MSPLILVTNVIRETPIGRINWSYGSSFTISTALISDQAFLETKNAWYQNMFHRIKQHPNKFPCWRVEGGKLYKFVKTGVEAGGAYR